MANSEVKLDTLSNIVSKGTGLAGDLTKIVAGLAGDTKSLNPEDVKSALKNATGIMKEAGSLLTSIAGAFTDNKDVLAMTKAIENISGNAESMLKDGKFDLKQAAGAVSAATSAISGAANLVKQNVGSQDVKDVTDVLSNSSNAVNQSMGLVTELSKSMESGSFDLGKIVPQAMGAISSASQAVSGGMQSVGQLVDKAKEKLGELYDSGKEMLFSKGKSGGKSAPLQDLTSSQNMVNEGSPPKRKP